MRRPLDSFPCAIGPVPLSVFPHVGPASYTVVTVTPGTVPAAGGDTVSAGPESGMKQFNVVLGGITDDGAFLVEAIPVTPSNPSTGVLTGIPSTTYKLRWISRITAAYGGQNQTAGTEVVATTDLSAQCVRLTAIGTKM